MFTITPSDIKNVPEGTDTEELQETIDEVTLYLRVLMPNLMSLTGDRAALAKNFICKGISKMLQDGYAEGGGWSAGPFSEDSNSKANENPDFPHVYLNKLYALCGVNSRVAIIELSDKFTKPGWEEHVWLVDSFGDN